MKRVLPRAFFEHSTLKVARELIGMYVVRKLSGQQIALMITETEAYDGPLDQACHAHRGKTARTVPMYDRAGTIYVYFIYGMYHMLNIVTGPKGYPAAVLIRGVQSEKVVLDGPGKLTRELRIDKTLNHQRLGRKSGLWIEDRGIIIPKGKIKRTPRIGVSYAKEWAEKPYRFVYNA